jgi:hypothetical protein
MEEKPVEPSLPLKTEGRWYVSKETGKPIPRNGVMFCRVTAQLHHDSCPERVFSTLSGPTAESSLQDYAVLLNKRGTKPPPEAPPRMHCGRNQA